MNNTLSLQELFNDRIFRIPAYQRGYAWEEQQVEEFLEDLALLDETRMHYTGTVVLHQPVNPKRRMDEGGHNFVEADVVDGQQRLTTIVILLNELSKALAEYDDSRTLAEGIRKMYVRATDIDRQPLHKLTLNNDTNEFFRSSVLPVKPSIDVPPVISAQRLLDAREQIAAHLRAAEGDVANREKWLRDLHLKITNRLHFNLYEVERAGEVGVIFEVMNDRGKQLTDLEKVKNYLLYCASSLGVSQHSRDELADSINDAWGAILRQLMDVGLGTPANENTLLRSDWLIRYDPQRQNWRGSRSVRLRFDLRKKERHVELLDDLHAYVRGLRESCVALCDALRPGRTGAFGGVGEASLVKQEAVLWNRRLLRIRLTATYVPLLMAVRLRWPGDLNKYLETVKLCEVLAFRTYRIAGYYVNFRQPAVFRLARRVMEGMKFTAAMRELKQMYSTTYAQQNFDEFTDPGHRQSRYDWTGLRYFLYEYEQHLAEKAGGEPKVDWTQVSSGNTIEHVLPQSIENRDYWKRRFTPDEHEEYRHDLGNLSLTMNNPTLSNKSFPEKKGSLDHPVHCYSKSLLLEEEELARWDDWTRKSIDDRRAMLLMWAKERWQIDFSDNTDDAYADELDDSDDEYDE